MKIRTNFVSNSSSSSFIVTNKNVFDSMINLLEQVEGDYYIFEDIMYTSCIPDYLDNFNEIYDLADSDISTGFNNPYDEENFIEFEGDRGVDSVWIRKDIIINSEKYKFFKSLIELDNPEVNDIIKTYNTFWKNEVEKWLQE